VASHPPVEHYLFDLMVHVEVKRNRAATCENVSPSRGQLNQGQPNGRSFLIQPHTHMHPLFHVKVRRSRHGACGNVKTANQHRVHLKDSLGPITVRV